MVVGRFHTPIRFNPTFRHNFCTFTHKFITNHISSAERTTQPLSTLAGILKKRGDGARVRYIFSANDGKLINLVDNQAGNVELEVYFDDENSISGFYAGQFEFKGERIN